MPNTVHRHNPLNVTKKHRGNRNTNNKTLSLRKINSILRIPPNDRIRNPLWNGTKSKSLRRTRRKNT